MRAAGVALVLVMLAPLAEAAPLSPSASADLVRGMAAVGSRVSDAPALRGQASGAPSPAFVAGAALGAWLNASAGLTNDVAHPLGDGGEAGTVSSDCFDEKRAFGALEAASAALGVSPADAVRAAGLSEEAAVAWIARRAAPPAACRG